MLMTSLPPRDVSLCVFFLHKQHTNNTKTHGNQVRKNGSTFAVCTKNLDAEPGAMCVPGRQRPPRHPGNRGRGALRSRLSLQAPGASGRPSGYEILLLASRDHPPPRGCGVLSGLGRASGLDLAALSQASLPGTVGGKALGDQEVSWGAEGG